VNNCEIIGNTGITGGGAAEGVLNNCRLLRNAAGSYGGGAAWGILNNCALLTNSAFDGGAASWGTLNNCQVFGNTGFQDGGGGCYETMNNCIVAGNSAGWGGGGAMDCWINNCTIVGNDAPNGGGAWGSILRNSIIYYNSAAQSDPNCGSLCSISDSCTVPSAIGSGNITNEPAFVDPANGDFHLRPGSPCIDAGTDLSTVVTNDLDGNPRPLDGNGDGIVAFDMGAYEFVRELTPCEAVEGLIAEVAESSLAWNRKRPLIATLLAACASFERSRFDAGVKQLRAFQNKVRAQVTRLDAQLAEDLIGAAQEIIDALTAPEPEPEPIPNMVWIPPGTFSMGSPPDEPARFVWEGPQTEVTISRGFWMGKYEVTQGEYLEVVGNNPSYFRNGTTPDYTTGTAGPVTNELQHPVERVSWIDATNYCALLTERERFGGRLPEGYEYRLPTEAQWEYACRAGTTTAFHYGGALRSGMANFNGHFEYPPCGGDEYCYNPSGIHLGRTVEVGSYAPNAWGLYDMHGNVWEWCMDWYAGSLPGGSVTDPTGPTTGSSRVFRGGSYYYDANHCRSALRFWSAPGYRGGYLGFRVALVAVP
jgi:sulfatase modifying factor 1